MSGGTQHAQAGLQTAAPLRERGEAGAAQRTRLFLFDLDGVIYRGDEPIETAIRFLENLAALRIPYGFVTNHAGKTPLQIAEKLRRMGIAVTREQIVTSAEAAAEALSAVTDARVLSLGTLALDTALAERRVVATCLKPTHVLVGYVEHITNSALSEALHWINKGAALWATNLDATAPGVPWTHLECGAFANLLEQLSGCPARYFGKPSPAIFELALKRFGVSADRAVMVGDRLDTDIAGAQAAGLQSVLALTGHTRTPPCDGAIRPDHVVADLSRLDPFWS